MDKFQILVAFVVLVFIVVLVGVIAMSYCFCGRENEYTEIRDDDIELGDHSDSAEFPVSSSLPVSKVVVNDPAVKAIAPKPKEKSHTPADVLAQEIDYFVRHMDHFYATGFYCSVLVLEHQMNMMDRVRSKTLREFVRSRPEFKMRSNLLSFKLTALTPFREPGVQVSGKFQCVASTCNHKWTSLNSLADHYQLCPSCSAHVYPFEQNPLTKAEIEQSLSTPPDANFFDQTDVDHAMTRDTLDVLSSIQSPIKPVLSSYQTIAP